MSTSSVSHLRWIEKHDAVCPSCRRTGHLSYQESSWDHRCPRTGTVWTWNEYRTAIRDLLAEFAA